MWQLAKFELDGFVAPILMLEYNKVSQTFARFAKAVKTR